MSFELPQLSYSYNSLEPHIDARTMEIHHTKHHAGYAAKLNSAIAGTNLERRPIEDILQSLDMENSALRNNAGGFYNHCLFWAIMSPRPRALSGDLADSIRNSFGSFDEFKTAFGTAAGTQFGSGWAWLCVNKGGRLEVCSTANQDNPLMPGIACDGVPILGIDVWEHAYYLNYQNRRPEYIDAFFNVIDWGAVANLFDAAK
jgi:Fe-Mn family superoxide dismutase